MYNDDAQNTWRFPPDMVSATVRSSIKTEVVVDDIAMLNNVDKFNKWVSTAFEDAIYTFVDKCVPGSQAGCVDFTGRGTCKLDKFFN